MKTLYWFEIKMFMRDYRTLFFSVILPVLLMPILFRTVQGFQHRKDTIQQKTPFSYVLSGPFSADFRRIMRSHTGFREFPVQDRSIQHLKDGFFDLVIQTYDHDHPLPVTRQPVKSKGKEKADTSIGADMFRQRQADRPGILIVFVADRERSLLARAKLLDILNDELRKYRDQRLQSVAVESETFLKSETVDQATDRTRAGARIAPLLPLILVFLILGGASVAAVDCVAGERERGTLETLLTSCLPQSSIVAAKQLAVLSLALFITLFELSNLLLFIRIGWIEAADFLLLQLTPLNCLLLILVASLLALTISSLLLYVSASSNNFKEAQLALFPALILSIALSAAGTLPELRLGSVVALVPLTGISVAIREILCETPSWGGLFLCLLTHLAVTAGLLWGSRSKLIPQGEFRSSFKDSVPEQQRQYLKEEIPWVYALCLAAILTVPSNVPALLTLGGQVFFNQGLMILAPLLLLLRHRIPLRLGFRLQPVSFKVVLACFFIAPLIQLCAQSSVWATGEFLPVSEQMLKEMTRMLTPENMPTWSLVLILALSPAICEELAFRGPLLYSLCEGGEASLSYSRKLKISLMVGLAFGCFHLSFFRILPTALTGFWITLLALETGSIIPGMLVHFGNNAIAVAAHRSQIELGNLPPWAWAASWLGLILIFMWLRKDRSKGTATLLAK